MSKHNWVIGDSTDTGIVYECTKCGNQRTGPALPAEGCAVNPQADLLEKLSMIQEAVERNPDGWWRELEGYHPLGMAWVNFEGPDHLIIKLNQWDVRLKPRYKWVEGWVSTSVLDEAKEGNNFPAAARALIKLAEEAE